MRKLFVLLIPLLILPTFAIAQEDSQAVTITAEDGLDIIGDYYAPDAEEFPAVLLLHMLGSNRSAWQPLIPTLLENNMAVLNLDMRGHGETGGNRDWATAETDIQLALDWLKAQTGVTMVATVGGSIGSNMALRAAANDPEVITVIALSPGLNYQDVTTQDAIEAITDQPILLIGSRNDGSMFADFQTLFASSSSDMQIRLFNGRIHGTNLLNTEPEINPIIIHWLNEQFQLES